MIAVASPLPATIPSTLVASLPYWRAKYVDKRIVLWGSLFGVPSAMVGALLTEFVSGPALIIVTDVVIFGLAIRILLERRTEPSAFEAEPTKLRIAVVLIGVGLVAGLLANSGGFLLAPLFIVALNMGLRKAFGASLVLSTVLAIPGTVVHAYLGHIDWYVTLVFALASVPLAAVGARVALRTNPKRLEWMYAVLLILVSVASLGQLA